MSKVSKESSSQPFDYDTILRETMANQPGQLVRKIAELWCNENEDGYLHQTHPLVSSLLSLPIANGRLIRPIARSLYGVPPNNWVLTSHWTRNDPKTLDESIGGILGVRGEHTLWSPLDTLRRLNGQVRRRGNILHVFLTQWEIAGLYQINLPMAEYNPNFDPKRLPDRFKDIARNYKMDLKQFMEEVNILPFKHRIGRVEY